VVLCARPAELEPAIAQTLAELRREGPLVHVDLAGLDEDAVAALVARRTGSSDPDAARRLRARSGGNPFFLGELLREAEETGGDAEGPPAGVRDVIERRLARLGTATLRALEVAAVCGLEFNITTLAAVHDKPVVDVLEALDGARAAALVADTDRPGRYVFAHALVGETITAALPASRRARLHLKVADVLAERHETGEVGAGEVAWHLRAAEPLVGAERLATWELAAAREATAALADADAAAHYEAALAGGRDAELLLALGHAHYRAGRRERARGVFREAAELACAAGDADLLARAAVGYGETAVVLAAADPAAVRLLEDALAGAPAADPATAARLLSRLSIEFYSADPARADELSAAAVERARRLDDAGALAAALNARRVALWSPQHVDERLAVAGEMVAAADAAGDREAQLQARSWRIVDLLELGRTREVATEIDAYDTIAEAVALPHFRWYVPLWRGTLAVLAGHWDEAEAQAERALELAKQADDPNGPIFVGIQRGFAFYGRRSFPAHDRQRLVTQSAESPVTPAWHAYVALYDAETGATESARRLLAELNRDGAPAMDVNWHAVCALADVAALVGDRDAGAALYALLERHAPLFPVVGRAMACLGSNELYVGRLAGLLGRYDEAAARLRRAVAANERAGAGPHAALALLRLGEALVAGGQPESAREALQQAARRADSLAIPALAADARRLLGATVA
jgi:tetratricopeptide (TPR) repeat protein